MSDLPALWHFGRPQAAAAIARRLGGGERIAMFGPRQTGKTTFLREEVMPAIEQAGGLAVYIECWADRADPLGSINYALAKAVESIETAPRGLRRAARTPVRKVGLAGASLELGEAAKRREPGSPFLQVDHLLTRLLEQTKKRVALLFDEFQAIANVDDADRVAAALRAALTQAGRRAGAIFSGSSQTLLLQLFSRARAPLYGFAKTEAYEVLGDDFLRHVAAKFEKATDRPLPRDEAQLVFAQLGHQPEPFLHAVANAMSHPRWSLGDGLAAMLDPATRNKWTINWFALTDLQRAALRLVFEGKPPTGAESLKWVSQQLGSARVHGSSVQRALESLQSSGLVARAEGGRGYEISDPVMATWLERNRALPLGAR
jgi:uncharacterized protein